VAQAPVHLLRQRLHPQALAQDLPAALLAEGVEQQLWSHFELAVRGTGTTAVEQPVERSAVLSELVRHLIRDRAHQLRPRRQPCCGGKARPDERHAVSCTDVLEQSRVDTGGCRYHCGKYLNANRLH
jgi:hypothetical protein